MRIKKDDFVKWSPELAKVFHKWDVMIPFGPVGRLQMRQTEFLPEDYDTPEDQYEALCGYINGCRFSGTEYYVFCDEKLVLNF